jgi:hypothetical protein
MPQIKNRKSDDDKESIENQTVTYKAEKIRRSQIKQGKSEGHKKA